MISAYQMHLYMKAKYGGRPDECSTANRPPKQPPTCLGVTKQGERCQIFPGEKKRFCCHHSPEAQGTQRCLGKTKHKRRCRLAPGVNHKLCHIHRHKGNKEKDCGEKN